MSDFWSFRKMVTPVIIEILFWVGVIVCLIAGLILVVAGLKPVSLNRCFQGCC